MSELHGVKPGPWCPVYHKTKDRTECRSRNCMYYVSHRTTREHSQQDAGVGTIDFDENLNAHSVSKAKIFRSGVRFMFHEKSAWHCCRYDPPSELEELPYLEKDDNDKSV